jgi:hypothetical protein
MTVARLPSLYRKEGNGRVILEADQLFMLQSQVGVSLVNHSVLRKIFIYHFTSTHICLEVICIEGQAHLQSFEMFDSLGILPDLYLTKGEPHTSASKKFHYVMQNPSASPLLPLSMKVSMLRFFS